MHRDGEAIVRVEGGDTVIITYRGKERARLVRIEESDRKIENPAASDAFGMWADRADMRDVDENTESVSFKISAE